MHYRSVFTTAILLLLALVACGRPPAKLFSIGGSVTGLDGTLTLQNNGADDLVVTVDGPFTFPTKLPDGSAYAVSIARSPYSQNCSVTNGSGAVHGASVGNVLVSCADKTWHGPANLSDHLSLAGTEANDPQAAFDPGGDALVVWDQDDGNTDQIYKAALHDGAWDKPDDLSDHLSVAGTGAYAPQVAFGPGGDALVVWRQSDGNDTQIYKAALHDGAWTIPASLSDHLSVAGTIAEYPQVAFGPGGEALVVWQQKDGSGNYQIYKAAFHDGAWDTPDDLSDHLSLAGTDAYSSQVAFGPGGDALVMWEQWDGHNYHIYKAEFHDGAWTIPASLSDHLSLAGTTAGYPQVAFGPGGEALVVWDQDDGSGNYQIYKAARHDGAWDKPDDLSDHLSLAGSSAYEPQVAFGPGGEALVVWRQKDGSGNYQIYKAAFHDGAWDTPDDLSDHLSLAGTGAWASQVAFGPGGDALVMWEQWDGHNYHIYKAALHDGAWDKPDDLSDHLSLAGTTAEYPQVTFGAGGEALVVWQQKDGSGDLQIYKAELR